MHDDDIAQQTPIDHATIALNAIEDVRAYNGNGEAYHAALANTRALAAERDALIRYARWLQDNRGGDIYGEECPSDEEIAAAQAEHGVAALLEDDEPHR